MRAAHFFWIFSPQLFHMAPLREIISLDWKGSQDDVTEALNTNKHGTFLKINSNRALQP